MLLCAGPTQTCERFALHPTDVDAREEHAQQCAARHRRLASLAASQEVNIPDLPLLAAAPSATLDPLPPAPCCLRAWHCLAWEVLLMELGKGA